MRIKLIFFKRRDPLSIRHYYGEIEKCDKTDFDVTQRSVESAYKIDFQET